MTYLDAYRQCKTKEQLLYVLDKDIFLARFIGSPERIGKIEDALNIVAEEKGWDLDGYKIGDNT